MEEGQDRFRIWSAASSTGEEPYTIAMTVLEAAGGRRIDFKVLATDLSTRVLGFAREGVYEAKRLEGVRPGLRDAYFERTQAGEAPAYRVRPILRQTVVFQRINLAETPYVMKGPFDAIFCRNVMIYFDEEVRKRLLGEMLRLLRPSGYLLVGHSESLAVLATQFKSVKPSVYLKPASRAVEAAR